jgi:cytochrome c oxidase subunit 2
MKYVNKLFSSFVLIAAVVLSHTAMAAQPEPWGIDLQQAATPSMGHLRDFHEMTLWIITGIVIFVTALLAFVMIRFNERANPTPSKTTHHVMLEVVWTIVPVLILIVIVVPSMKLLYYTDRTEKPEMTLKVTGYQWYWGYEYPDQGGIAFQSNMVPEKDLKEGQVRLLSTDNPVVIPVDTNIQVMTTAADVIHSFAVPAFGVKKDAVPGRANETWIRVTKPGIYYGQCSEICGTGHAFMPIEIKAVTKDEFTAWVAAKKKEQGIADSAPVSAPTPEEGVKAEDPSAAHKS